MERGLQNVCRLGIEDLREWGRHGFGYAELGGLTNCGLRRREMTVSNARTQSGRSAEAAGISEGGKGTYSGVCKEDRVSATLVFDTGEDDEGVDNVQTCRGPVGWDKALDTR